MGSEALEEYGFAFVEEAYKDPGQRETIGFMVSGGRFHDENASCWEG